MKVWHIAAHGSYEAEATDPADPLIETLRTVVPVPPRRINRYTRLTLIGAYRCLAKYSGGLKPETPLYLASEHGNIAETVSLMVGILFEGERPKPMSFVNVSSNMAGFYLAASLGLVGRNMTVARQNSGFGAMLELAALDPLNDGPMLLGSVGEAVWPLEEHRGRQELPAGTPLVEASYWLVISANGESSRLRLGYDSTKNVEQARSWLSEGEQWFVDPHFSAEQRQQLEQGLQAERRARAPLGNVGHPEAVPHALFTALQQANPPRLHAVVRDPGRGFQLIGVWAEPEPDA